MLFRDQRFTWRESLCLPLDQRYETVGEAALTLNRLTGLRMALMGKEPTGRNVILERVHIRPLTPGGRYPGHKDGQDTPFAAPAGNRVWTPDRPYSPLGIRFFGNGQTYTRMYWMSGIPDDAIGQPPFKFVEGGWLLRYQKWLREVTGLNLSGDQRRGDAADWGIFIQLSTEDNPAVDVVSISAHPTNDNLTRIAATLPAADPGDYVQLSSGEWVEGFVPMRGRFRVVAEAGGNIDVASPNQGAGYLGAALIRKLKFGLVPIEGSETMGQILRIRGVRGLPAPRGRR